MEKWRYLWGRISSKLWLRATLYCLFGVATALMGALARDLIPPGIALQIGADALGNILGIVAASMLAVTTFTLSIMVSAYASAANSATPRATRLLMADSNAQGYLATFVGAFLFSVVGIIALSAGLYGDGGRVVLFATTLILIVVIAVTLLRAIEQFPRFGRLGDTIELIEKTTAAALRRRADDPALGCMPWDGRPLPGHDICVDAATIGYVQFVDVPALAALADSHDFHACVLAAPGMLAAPGRPLLRLDRAVDAEVRQRLAAAFVIAGNRSIDDDPRYGLVVLTEVAVRAGSAAVNDPGTAIDIIATVTRLLAGWATARRDAGPAEVRFPRLHFPLMQEADMYEDVFPLVARDSGGVVEVGIRLQKAFAALRATGHPPSVAAAAHHAQRALQRALQQLDFSDDRERLIAVARQWNDVAPDPPPR